MEPYLKIYFAGAIRGGRDDAHIYAEMINFLKNMGEVLTEHVGDQSLTEKGDDGPDDKYIHNRDMAWLYKCDIIVAEVSQPSLGVGYELGMAVSLGKPILCLYKMGSRQRLSAMISGSPDLEIIEYSDIKDAEESIRVFINRIISALNKDEGK
jgi:2'-deoxynucleoside 5'-phosphate N-hydrolase